MCKTICLSQSKALASCNATAELFPLPDGALARTPTARGRVSRTHTRGSMARAAYRARLARDFDRVHLLAAA